MLLPYKLLPKHTRLAANIILIGSIISLPFDWRGALIGIIVGALLHRFAKSQDADIIKISEKYKSHEGVREFKRKGFSDDQILEIQKQAGKQHNE